MDSIRVAVVVISARVNAKINAHGVSSVDVEAACEHLIGPRWSPDKNGTNRILALGKTDSGRTLKLVLYPAGDEGVWNLGTAYLAS